ncbi:MAG: monofunctional biosynthetic peptidoglycan transglycosylase [Bacteroidales bacterium]
MAVRTKRSTHSGRVGIRRILALVAKLLAVLVAISLLSVLALRWVRPVTGAVMLERRAGALVHGRWLPIRQQWVPWARISLNAPLAVIAAEDQKFPDHHGFDVESIQKAIDAHEKGQRLRGASTISQQVAKNLFLWSGRSFVRKGLEAYFTALIELLWPKRRILEVYLNIVELGEGVFGVEAASQRYFHKPAARLDADEAALLAAVLPNPLRLRVDRPSAYVQERRGWILEQMGQLGGTAFVKQLH